MCLRQTSVHGSATFENVQGKKKQALKAPTSVGHTWQFWWRNKRRTTLPGNGDTEKLALSATHFWTRTPSGQETRSFTSCSSRPSLGRFLYLRLHSRPVGQPPTAATCSGPPGKASTSGPKLGGSHFQPGRTDRAPRNRPPPVSHAGFLGVRPAGPRPSSSRTPAARPAETRAPALGRDQRTQLAGTPSAPHIPGTHLLSPRQSGRLAAQVSPRPPLFCFRQELADHRAGRPRPRPRGLIGVVISGLRNVGHEPRKGTEFPTERADGESRGLQLVLLFCS